MKKLALILAILALSFASLIGGPTWLAHVLAGDTDPAATVASPAFSVFNFSFYFVTSVEQFGPRLGRSPGLAAIGFALTSPARLSGWASCCWPGCTRSRSRARSGGRSG